MGLHDINWLRQAVAEEIRSAGLISGPRPSLPLPNDLDTEALLLSSVLDGIASTRSLWPLAFCDFYSNFHRALFLVLDIMEARHEELSMELVSERLRELGLGGPIESELRTVWFAQPFVLKKHLPTLALKIRWLRIAREAIALMQSADFELRNAPEPMEVLARLCDSISALLTDGEPLLSSLSPLEKAERSEFRAARALPQPEHRPAGRSNGKPQGPSVIARPNTWPSNGRIPGPSGHNPSTKTSR